MSSSTKGERDLLHYPPRERVLAAALKLFVEKGYFNTSVPDLSKESHCSVGSIYHTFKNKEEIASALYLEGLTAFRNAIYESVKDEKDCQRTIKKVIKSFLRFCEVNHQLSRYMWLNRHREFISGKFISNEGIPRGSGHPIQQPTMVGFDPLGRLLTQTIKRGIRAGLMRPLKANLIWSILFGTPLAYVRDWLDGYNTEPPSSVADELANACWRALCK